LAARTNSEKKSVAFRAPPSRHATLFLASNASSLAAFPNERFQCHGLRESIRRFRDGRAEGVLEARLARDPRGSCAGMCCRSRPKAVLSDTEPERYQRPQRLPGWLTNVIKAEAGIAPSMLSAFEDGTGLRCPPFSVIKTVSRILLFSRYWCSLSNCSTGVIEKRTSRQPSIRLNSGGESISGAQPSVDGTVRADESNRVAHLR
jgi:hypothetical protein